MSTKLYYGIRFKSRSMADILQQLVSIRKETVKLANDLLTVEEIKDFIVLNDLTNSYKYVIFNALKNDLDAKCRTILSVDFNFTISLIPEKNGYVYGYYFADHPQEYYQLIEPFVVDYHYQNQCDKPSNISNKAWNYRRKKWDKLLGYDSFTQRAFSFTMVNSSDLNFSETLRKIKIALTEIKEECPDETN